MWNYLARRLLLAVLTLWLVTFLVYGLIRSMPGDPTLVQLEQMGPKAKLRSEDLEQLKRIYGLDKPWPQAYAEWLGRLFQLNLGNSFSRHERRSRMSSHSGSDRP
jgi:peptide/nickel transport system permease protein